VQPRRALEQTTGLGVPHPTPIASPSPKTAAKDFLGQRTGLHGSNLRTLDYLRRLPMNMTTSTRQAGGVTIVDISGRIVLGEESAALRDKIHDLLSKGHKQILLNLVAVDSIDSMGLGTLVGAFATV